MSERFQWVGVVKKARPGDGHVVGEVPGKVALVLHDPEVGSECLAYFPRDRRPKVGVRVGARGEYVQVDVPPEAIPPEDREWMVGPGCTAVQHQLDVAEWSVVSEDYDPFFD